MNEKKIIRRLSAVGICGNIALAALKMCAGILGRSAAMISDAVHSLADVLATLVACIGVLISKKAPDRGHPYGHERIECVASGLLGLILLATGLAIGAGGAEKIAAGHYDELATPSAPALIAAAVRCHDRWLARNTSSVRTRSVWCAASCSTSAPSQRCTSACPSSTLPTPTHDVALP